MIRKKPRLLVVEDDEAASFAYERFLVNAGFETKTSMTLGEASKVIETESFDAVLLDLKLPDGNALQWLPRLKKIHPHTPVIVITGTSDIPTAVQATKNGAENFLTKPIDMQDLGMTLNKCLELETLRKRNMVQQRLAKKEEPFFGLSDAMTSLMEYAQVAADNDSVILLLGETGVGKGVLARWIHNNSQRRAEAFVELNCSSLKGELLRSELFGHVKGSFTSAIKDREGLIEVADGGTLFLDEIGDMDAEVQAQLLKTIEEKSFRRIGENLLRKSDFRLICATNRDLLKETEDRRFRKDLYYRICVFPISIPPLRKRVEDIAGLAEHILSGFGYIEFPLADDVLTLLKTYAWPGNVRELRNMLERGLLLAHGTTLSARHFPGLDIAPPSSAAAEYQDLNTLSDIEKAHIVTILKKYNGDKLKASRVLGISLSSLYRKIHHLKQAE
jgi:DNA-binding NtrC family response regulator